MTLQNLQADLADILSSEAETSDLIAPAKNMSIYRNNIMSNLIETLKNTYPLIYKLVGDDFFRACVKEYSLRYPSRNSNLNEYGEYFSDFLGEYEPAASLLYLAEVAYFEWICHALSFAPDIDAFNMQTLAAIKEEQYDKLQLILNPAARIHQFYYPILRIIDLCEERIEEINDLNDGGVRLLILRRDNNLILLTLSAGEEAFLNAISQGDTLALALKKALKVETNFKLEEKLPIWIQNKTIIDCYLVT